MQRREPYVPRDGQFVLKPDHLRAPGNPRADFSFSGSGAGGFEAESA
jgi:hypothetical protein